MIDKKRLEGIKEKYNFRSIDRFVDVKLVNPQDLKWLIQQAEKVEYWMKQHRKRCNELEDAYFKIQLIENQNKRYRKALEAIYELAEYDEYANTLDQVVLEVEKALGEDNEPIRAEVSE